MTDFIVHVEKNLENGAEIRVFEKTKNYTYNYYRGTSEVKVFDVSFKSTDALIDALTAGLDKEPFFADGKFLERENDPNYRYYLELKEIYEGS